MESLLLFIQFSVVVALIIAILLQKTGTDSLSGLSGSSGIFSHKTASTVFTRITLILAAAFIVNTLMIAKTTKAKYMTTTSSIIDSLQGSEQAATPDVKKAPTVED